MLSAEETLRRLTIGDRTLLATIADLDLATTPAVSVLRLDPRAEALVRLAVLVALDARQSTYSASAEQAFLAGATLDDLVSTLLAVAGEVGSPRVTAAAPRIALAAGYNIDEALEEVMALDVEEAATEEAEDVVAESRDIEAAAALRAIRALIAAEVIEEEAAQEAVAALVAAEIVEEDAVDEAVATVLAAESVEGAAS